MRVFVTGADGYIGAVVLPELLRRGHEVAGLDTGFYRDGCLYDGLAAPQHMLKRDVRQIAAADLAGFDAVVHLAELSNDPLGQLDPALTHRMNFEGSLALARACKRAGVQRFVYASSCSVYGVGNSDTKDESSQPLPQTAYAECKVLVEQYVAPLADDAFSPTFLRNATAFGASPRMRFDIVLNNLAGLAATTGVIRMTSDGTPWRPLVHVADIAGAIASVLEAPREAVHNEIFNVGENAQNYQVREIAAVVAEVFEGCALEIGSNGGDNRSYRVAFDKIHAHLPAFRCQHSLLDGARELRDLFARIGFTREMFEFRAYTRLRQLEYLLATGQLDADLFWTNENTSAGTTRHASTHAALPVL